MSSTVSLAGREALVLGMGASGMAAARLLCRHNVRVTLLDAADTIATRKPAAILRAMGCAVITAAAELPEQNFDLCVASPGLPSDHPWLRAARRRAIPVLAELELGWSFLNAPVVAVTGSNGKSTMVKLCADALRKAGRRTCIAGNYGPPVSLVALQQAAWDIVVIEVSSFQLEQVQAFRPEVGVLLNVHPNHLDRHGDLESYRRLKLRLFERMGAGDTAIIEQSLLKGLPADNQPGKAAGRCLSFGMTGADILFQAGAIQDAGGRVLAELKGTAFDNPVGGLTAAAVAAVLCALGIDPAVLTVAAQEFKSLPHRRCAVALVRGVRFIDDSKSTNLAALCAALQAVPAPIRLIAGGMGKGESFAPAAALIRERVAGLYLIGRDASVMAEAWRGAAASLICDSLERACEAAWHDARSGDTILLSPACASYDQFRNYAERGERFIDWVRRLARK
ncbi:MAG: UDP-N-acetylmuramoyl-L-alanine--D-glutamate ligase [Kiritimatiellia bacterium]